MCVLSFKECLDGLDGLMINDVCVGEIVRTIEDLREYVEIYYMHKNKNIVIEIFELINYILGGIELNYIKNNHLNHYRHLRSQILRLRWDSLGIEHKRVIDDDDEDCEDNCD